MITHVLRSIDPKKKVVMLIIHFILVIYFIHVIFCDNLLIVTGSVGLIGFAGNYWVTIKGNLRVSPVGITGCLASICQPVIYAWLTARITSLER